ncbi:MAG: hypothetical protein KJ583_00585 [Nanoarchaeota archaeon]|nr:hypothetical protein [Nanoarchaeota archaeon]MBU1269278.1 hypothetical protein [Nanoarchaeota archaeon]MBU1603785.1 hypothetical protein [Nanoarchaeota archaeon]MBU2443910.1 hypothetical protein [Nanoarchaeota archaeon]
MKKIFVLVLIFAFVLSLTACSQTLVGKGGETDITKPGKGRDYYEPPIPPTNSTTPPTDPPNPPTNISGSWKTVGNNVFSFPTGVNVGIGTENPKWKLDVNGIVGVGVASDTNNPQIMLSDEGNVGRIQSFNGPLAINPQGNNVGIGTNNPTQALTVKGNILAEGTKGGTGYYYQFVENTRQLTPQDLLGMRPRSLPCDLIGGADSGKDAKKKQPGNVYGNECSNIIEDVAAGASDDGYDIYYYVSCIDPTTGNPRDNCPEADVTVQFYASKYVKKSRAGGMAAGIVYANNVVVQNLDGNQAAFDGQRWISHGTTGRCDSPVLGAYAEAWVNNGVVEVRACRTNQGCSDWTRWTAQQTFGDQVVRAWYGYGVETLVTSPGGNTAPTSSMRYGQHIVGNKALWVDRKSTVFSATGQGAHTRTSCVLG